MESAGIAYSVTAVVLAATLIWLARADSVTRLAQWRPRPGAIRFIGRLAAVILVVGLLDELGLLLVEWNLPSGPLGSLRWFEGLPGFTQLLYVSNLVLVVPATVQVLNEHAPLERGPFSRGAEIGVAMALQFVSLTLLLTGLQLLVWQETGPWPMGLIAALVIVVSFSLSSIVCAGAIGRLQRIREGGLDPLQRLHQWDVWLILFGTVLLQTMITKAGLLLVVIPRCRDTIGRILARLVPYRTQPPAGEQGITLESLAHHIRQGDTVHRFGFYLLFTSGFAALFFWQSHASAFAPADSAFPRTQTINLLYTLDILLLAWALTTKRRLAIIGASAFLMVTRHLLYILTPSWFAPALNPPGFSPVEALASLFGAGLAAPLFSFAIHICVMALFWTQVQCLTLAQRVMVDHQAELLPPLFRWCLIQELASYTLPLLVAGTLVGVVISVDAQLAQATGQAALNAGAQRAFVHAVGAIGLVIFCLLNLIMEWQIYRTGRSQPDQLYAELRRRWGEAGIERLLELHSAAGRYGRDRKRSGLDRLLLLHGGVAGAHLVAAGLMAVTG